jgi:KDO2-lipid IV(A) lauroyltransferase
MTGAREIISILKKGEHVGMLVDQKLNEGMAIPFFGRDAMTAEAVALFALRIKCKLYPARIERLHGVHFRFSIYPPLHVENTGDREKDVRKVLTDINMLLESWIRERPEQWLWTHRRWPKDI